MKNKSCCANNYVINFNRKRYSQRTSNKQILSNIFYIMLIRCIFITDICDTISKLNLKCKKYLYLKMKNKRLIIFASIMSFCTSTFVSAFIVFLKIGLQTDFLAKWFERFLIAWPVVFFCIIIFVPLINAFLDRYLKNEN